MRFVSQQQAVEQIEVMSQTVLRLLQSLEALPSSTPSRIRCVVGATRRSARAVCFVSVARRAAVSASQASAAVRYPRPAYWNDVVHATCWRRLAASTNEARAQ